MCYFTAIYCLLSSVCEHLSAVLDVARSISSAVIPPLFYLNFSLSVKKAATSVNTTDLVEANFSTLEFPFLAGLCVLAPSALLSES